MRTKDALPQLLAVSVLCWVVAACGGKPDRPPVVTSAPPATTTVPVEPTMPEREVIMDPSENNDLITMDPSDPLGIVDLPLETINDMRPLADIRFDYDSAMLSADARMTLDSHAETLEAYPTMTILIEGHCDERGTVEYNLALGERRANSVLNYLTSLGIGAGRLRTISYGKEFPEDPGHNDAAWARNRRGHFEITAK